MIEPTTKERIVVIGGGFGGIEFIKRVRNSKYQIVLIDRHNYHQFQPLFYQVATSGLEPSSISFPFRRNFQSWKNVHFRLAEVLSISPETNTVSTNIGDIEYDHLVIATGAGNNFFGNKLIEENAFPMKSLNESLKLRNTILEHFETALSQKSDRRKEILTFTIVGGGPTGVELAGTLAEMKRFVLPKDYPELDFDEMRIIIVEGEDRLLAAMNSVSSEKALKYLKKLGVEVILSTHVENYSNDIVQLSSGEKINSAMLIWAAGIKGNFLPGISEEVRVKGNRIKVNGTNRIEGYTNVYAIGDIASVSGDPEYPNGHPQLAQVAIQQGKHLARYFKDGLPKEYAAFKYKNLGTMATIGRNKAVVELPVYKFQGFFAWMVWMLVHLRSILGIRNKFLVFMNWVWNYFTYNLSLRLIIKRNDRD